MALPAPGQQLGKLWKVGKLGETIKRRLLEDDQHDTLQKRSSVLLHT